MIPEIAKSSQEKTITLSVFYFFPALLSYNWHIR